MGRKNVSSHEKTIKAETDVLRFLVVLWGEKDLFPICNLIRKIDDKKKSIHITLLGKTEDSESLQRVARDTTMQISINFGIFCIADIHYSDSYPVSEEDAIRISNVSADTIPIMPGQPILQ